MSTLTNVTVDSLRACIADPGAVLPRAKNATGSYSGMPETIANWGARAIIAQHATEALQDTPGLSGGDDSPTVGSQEPTEAGKLRSLVHEAQNIVWSADNGGHNGRPSEVKRILEAICQEAEKVWGAS